MGGGSALAKRWEFLMNMRKGFLEKWFGDEYKSHAGHNRPPKTTGIAWQIIRSNSRPHRLFFCCVSKKKCLSTLRKAWKRDYFIGHAHIFCYRKCQKDFYCVACKINSLYATSLSQRKTSESWFGCEKLLFRASRLIYILRFGSSCWFFCVFFRVGIFGQQLYSGQSHGSSSSDKSFFAQVSRSSLAKSPLQQDFSFPTGFFFAENSKSWQFKCTSSQAIVRCELWTIQHSFFYTACDQALLSSRIRFAAEKPFFCEDATRLFTFVPFLAFRSLSLV
jgi:hypothetical protein